MTNGRTDIRGLSADTNLRTSRYRRVKFRVSGRRSLLRGEFRDLPQSPKQTLGYKLKIGLTSFLPNHEPPSMITAHLNERCKNHSNENA